jgi:hypothetical protein
MDFRKFLTDNDWKFRHRTEGYNVIFTSETAILDAILANKEWADALTEFIYTDQLYVNEFANHKGIDAITDIKFVKRVPEHCYQVTFGNFEWRKEDELRVNLTEYLATNKDSFVFKGNEKEIIEAKSKGKTSTYYGSRACVFHGFRFYAKNPDDIIVIHMLAPGKVTHIVKLMERNRETITC